MQLPLLIKLAWISFTLVFLIPLGNTLASTSDDVMTITLEKPVYFFGTDGSPVIAKAGEYTVEAAEEWIKLIPGKQRRDALLLETEKGTHEVGAEIPIALSIPGDNAEELNRHYVQLLLPDGTSLEANGTYDGIFPRGKWWSKAKARAKKIAARARARAAAKARAARAAAAKARAKAAAKAKAMREAAAKAAAAAKREAERLAREAAEKAKWLAKQATIQSCKAFFIAQEKAAKLQEGVMKKIQQGVNELRKNSKVVNDIIAAAEKFQQLQKSLIDKAIQRALRFNQPSLLNQVKDMVKFNNICETGIAETKKKIQRLLNANQQVRSRGSEPVFSIGIQGAGTFKIGGIEGGAGIASNFKSTTGYGFVGGTVQMPSAGGAILAQVGGWNPVVVKTPKDLAGGYLALGYAIPIKEIAEHIYGFGNDYWVNAEGSLLNFIVNIDILFSWPKGKWHPNPIPAGVVVSPGLSGGISKAKDNFLSKHLGRITLQGGYGWVFGK